MFLHGRVCVSCKLGCKQIKKCSCGPVCVFVRTCVYIYKMPHFYSVPCCPAESVGFVVQLMPQNCNN